MMSQSPYIDFQEVCTLLKLKPTHLRSLIFKKVIPYIKIGRLIRFEKNALQEFLKQNSIGGSNE